MKIKLLFLILVLTTTCYSQVFTFQISGKIQDEKGMPLMGATITVDGGKYISVSNFQGEFSIDKVSEGKHVVKVSFIGLKTQTREIELLDKQKVKNLNFLLRKDTESLNEVSVIAMTEKTALETKGFAVNVIETKEASLRNIQTNELLNTTVGVKLRQNGGLGSNVEYSLNGLSGNSVSIFIDGIPISMYGSSFSLNSIPPAMIQDIRVYKGVVPGHLADDALGGAINIILKKGSKTNFNVSASYGSFNTFQTNLSGLYRFKKSGFTIKASAFHNYSDNDYEMWGGQVKHIEIDGSQTPITAKRFNDAYRSTGGIAQIGFTDVKWADQFLVGFTGSDDYKEVQHGAFVTILPYNGRFLESNALLTNLLYAKKDVLIKGLDINLTGLYGKRKRIVNDTVDQAYTWAGVKLQRQQFNQDGTVSIIDHKYTWGSQSEQGATMLNIDRDVSSLRTGISYAINKHHKIVVNQFYSGIERDESDEEVTLLEQTFQRTSDLYKNIYSLSYELNAFDKKLNVNVFGKHYRQKVLNIQPVFNDDETEVLEDVYTSDKKYNGYGVAASYAFIPEFTLILSSEKAIRLPNETEVFGDAGDNVIANLTVQPEVSKNYNLGFRLGKFYVNNHGFTIAANLFSRNIQDLIGLPANADESWENDELVQYANFDEKVTSKGFDAEINYSYNNNFGINFNISRLSLERVNRAGYLTDIPNTPLFTMNGGLRYSIKDLMLEKSRLNLFYRAYFTDEFLYIDPPGTNNTGLDAFKIPQQFIQDFGCSYTFPQERFVLSFDVKNMFNKAAYDNRSVQKPGRAFYLKLNYSINKF